MVWSAHFAQYNVLSSSLCDPSWYSQSAAEDLDPVNRLPRVQDKLQQQIILSDGKVIIALQEVSMAWLGPLDIWFHERGYKLVCSLYGNPKTDFMGVALAVPLAHYDVLETAVSCVGMAQQWGQEPQESDLRPGDWICPACQATCFASRSTCFKCNEQKPSGMGDKLKDAAVAAKSMLLLVLAAVTLASLWLPAVKWLLAKVGLYTPPKPRGLFRPNKSIWKQSVRPVLPAPQPCFHPHVLAQFALLETELVLHGLRGSKKNTTVSSTSVCDRRRMARQSSESQRTICRASSGSRHSW